MTQWIGKQDRAGPFDGCLVIMNLGSRNIFNIRDAYVEEVRVLTSHAHAGGWLTVYVYDDQDELGTIPGKFDYIEDMDFICSSTQAFGLPKLEFCGDPELRHEQLILAFKILANNPAFIAKSSGTIIGLCTIDGKKFLTPAIEVV